MRSLCILSAVFLAIVWATPASGQPRPCDTQSTPQIVEYSGPIRNEVPVVAAAPAPAQVWELWRYTDGSLRWRLITVPVVKAYPVPIRYQPMPTRTMPARPLFVGVQSPGFSAGVCIGNR